MSLIFTTYNGVKWSSALPLSPSAGPFRFLQKTAMWVKNVLVVRDYKMGRFDLVFRFDDMFHSGITIDSCRSQKSRCCVYRFI